MKQCSKKVFMKKLKNSGYTFTRCKGSHYIYTNSSGHIISVPYKIKNVIMLRLLKELKLNN